ncbi:MAG: glycolate oxidase iron-sulfur subunit [Gemmatimonadales bacterium]|nr:MAG: glycolate oxidase iron-sulfur subunit [Gemmatimonadales bacterium]
MTPNPFSGLHACVHCGFCLQSCPTFLVTGDESDSPRGRIVLLGALERGELQETDPDLILHLDRCLGCRACEPVCPSGVSYAPALEESRRRFATVRPIPWPVRLLLAIVGEPVLRIPFFTVARWIRPLASLVRGSSAPAMMFGMLAATRAKGVGNGRRWRSRRGPAGEARAQRPSMVALFRGCVMDGLFGHVHRATRRTLEVNGYRVVEVSGQDCCGALHAHAGLHDEAVRLARANVSAFAKHSGLWLAVNSAGCGAQIREYDRLLADDPLEETARRLAARTCDVTELLAVAGPVQGARMELKVAYDPPCHLLHAQRVSEAPLKVLQAIPGLEIVPHQEAALCCGSAGSYSLSQRELSLAILERKVEALAKSGAQVVATGNPGCIMQIGAGLRARGLDLPVVHPVELLDRSYALAGYYS